jgi:hypothetical protein
MTNPSSAIPSCRYCQYYVPQGRRGGECKQLQVQVHSNWKACSVAIPAFSPSWEELQQAIQMQSRPLGHEYVEAPLPSPELTHSSDREPSRYS